MFVSVAHAATEKARQGSGVFPPFDSSSFASQLLWLAITFGILYFLMSRVVIPRLSSILETRSDRIQHDLDEANRLKDESDLAHAAYEQELAEAKSNANKIAQDAKDTAKAAAEAKRSEVEDNLSKKLAESEKKIGAIKAKALAEVDTIASDAASAIVSELLGSKPTKTEITKAISAAVK